MDFASFGIASVGAITVVAYLIGMIVKASGLNNKWIPIICAASGLVMGVAGMFIMPEFPATDYISAAAVGIASGLAATGFNQVIKQLSNKE